MYHETNGCTFMVYAGKGMPQGRLLWELLHFCLVPGALYVKTANVLPHTGNRTGGKVSEQQIGGGYR